MRAMSIAQRVMLLQQGLNDRSGKIDFCIYKTSLGFAVVDFEDLESMCP